MDSKKLISRLDEISENLGRTDKEIQFSNLACKVHGLLTNKSGRLTAAESRGLKAIGEKVAELADGAGIKTRPLMPRGGCARRVSGGRGRDGGI